jgi:DNA-binding transcriptional ArsR family regulator
MDKTSKSQQMEGAAGRASALMKTLGHSGRLMILCNLAESLSQHLARMRNEGLVTARRESQTVYYSLVKGEAQSIIESLYEIYCPFNDTTRI